MHYNVSDIIDDNITDGKLKDIINKKLFIVIEFLEFNIDYFK